MHNKLNQSPLTQGETDVWVPQGISVAITSKEHKPSEYLIILYVATQAITILWKFISLCP